MNNKKDEYDFNPEPEDAFAKIAMNLFRPKGEKSDNKAGKLWNKIAKNARNFFSKNKVGKWWNRIAKNAGNFFRKKQVRINNKITVVPVENWKKETKKHTMTKAERKKAREEYEREKQEEHEQKMIKNMVDFYNRWEEENSRSLGYNFDDL